MAENYCGKKCEECAYKEQLNCPGCEQGPGNSWTGTCKIARCCDNKGHKTCDTCGHKSTCGDLRGKLSIPKERLSEIEYENTKKERISKMALKLSKWMTVLFWIYIALIITGLLSNNYVEALSPVLYQAGVMLGEVGNIICGAIFLIISTESNWYKTAGIFNIITPIVSIVIAVLIVLTESPIMLLSVIALLLMSLYGQYAQFKGHAEVLIEADPELSQKWDKLWKWNLILFGALIGSVIILIFVPVLGALAALASAIGAIIISILKPLFLYRTAETFKYIKANTINKEDL